MALDEYGSKRDFGATSEPRPGAAAETTRSGYGGAFVVQMHQATRLHWDLRLEDEGALKSWAVTKEPPGEPGVKRLAVHVEDHPLDYADFEGEIPAGQYGAGTVEIWDKGDYVLIPDKVPDETVAEAVDRGAFKFHLDGKKLRGDYVLYNFDKKGKNWFFFRMKD